MTARDRVRVMTKGYNSVVWFGNDYLWLASFQGLPTVIFGRSKYAKMDQKTEILERPGMKLLAIINLANKYSSSYSQ